jgi:hypothetical protein
MNGNQEKPIFGTNDLVYVYTDNQAINDGVITDLSTVINRYFKNSPFNYATSNLLLSLGYMTEGDDGLKLNVPCIIDLIISASLIYRKMPAGDYFACGYIEAPNGQKTKIFMAQNESGKFTLMLPEDY